MRKMMKIFLIPIISIIILFLFLVILRYALSWSAYYMFPNKARYVEIEYSKLSSDILIKKLSIFNLLWRDRVMWILAERKEKKAVPYLIKLLNSPDSYTRQEVIRALGKIGDERTIEPLMKIIKREKIDISYNKYDTPDNIIALKALSRMKYEKAYPYATWLASLKDDPNDFRSYGITMLEYFEKPESIPILQRIAKEDPKEYIREKAANAIKHIESLQK